MMSRAALFAAFLVALSGCSPGVRPFRVAQVCLANKEDALKLVQEMQGVANEEKMEFIDGSQEKYKDPGRKDGSSTVYFSVLRADGMGVIAGNIGLPGYQLAMGFTETSSRSDATRFVDKVVDRLDRYWHVEELPPGSRVRPDPNCTQHSSAPN